MSGNVILVGVYVFFRVQVCLIAGIGVASGCRGSCFCYCDFCIGGIVVPCFRASYSIVSTHLSLNSWMRPSSRAGIST